MAGPRIVATPPMTRPAMNSIERCSPKLSGPMVVAARAKHRRRTSRARSLRRQAPCTAPVHPETAAPVSLSRMAMRPRPTRLRTRLDVSRNSTSATTGQDPVVVRPAVRRPRRWVPLEASRGRDVAAGDGLAVAAAGEAGEVDAEEVVRLGDGGKGQGQTQRDQREVEAADSQRREADHEADQEADGARDRQVATNGQPWSATRIIVVGADPEEERVPDRDLPEYPVTMFRPRWPRPA